MPLRPALKRRLRRTAIVIAVLVGVFALPLFGISLGCRPRGERSTTRLDAQVPWPEEFAAYRRAEESTYLTFPEWYIVYSAQEYADFLDVGRPPSAFPYGAYIGQFWHTYCEVVRVTRSQYPFNVGDHVMLSFIGTSFSVEYAGKWLDEHTVGRLTELLARGQPTDEDRYARTVAREYADFLDTIPWYEFPFAQKLVGLWRESRILGPAPIRKWERKIALSFEYTLKAGYGWLTNVLTKSLFPPAATEIAVWTENIPAPLLAREPRIRPVAAVDASSQIVIITRYQAFSEIVPSLAREGVRFIQIAGNDDILLTVLAPRDWAAPPGAHDVLFSMPILTEPTRMRVALRLPVPSLPETLAAVEASGATFEHLYDY